MWFKMRILVFNTHIYVTIRYTKHMNMVCTIYEYTLCICICVCMYEGEKYCGKDIKTEITVGSPALFRLLRYFFHIHCKPCGTWCTDIQHWITLLIYCNTLISCVARHISDHIVYTKVFCRDIYETAARLKLEFNGATANLAIEGILPKGPYLLCVSMAGRAH